MRLFPRAAVVVVAIAVGYACGAPTESTAPGGHCPETSREPRATAPGTFTGTTDCGCGAWHCTCGSDMRWHECCCPEYFSEDPACSEQ